MKRPTPSRRRLAWHWPAWRLWVPALVLGALAVSPAPASAAKAGAERPGVQLFEWHEAMTLEEAALFLRIAPEELESLIT